MRAFKQSILCEGVLLLVMSPYTLDVYRNAAPVIVAADKHHAILLYSERISCVSEMASRDVQVERLAAYS